MNTFEQPDTGYRLYRECSHGWFVVRVLCPCHGLLDYVYANWGKCRRCGRWTKLW